MIYLFWYKTYERQITIEKLFYFHLHKILILFCGEFYFILFYYFITSLSPVDLIQDKEVLVTDLVPPNTLPLSFRLFMIMFSFCLDTHFHISWAQEKEKTPFSQLSIACSFGFRDQLPWFTVRSWVLGSCTVSELVCSSAVLTLWFKM